MQPQHNGHQGLTGWQTGAVGPRKSTSALRIRCLHPHDGDALPPPPPYTHTHTHTLPREAAVKARVWWLKAETLC